MIPEVPAKLSRKIEEKDILFMAGIELTTKCNLKCIHCYGLPFDNDSELTTDEIKNILDQLAKEGCLFLGLSGGEPLMREDFWEIAEFARERSFAVTIKTNGTLITPTIADKIEKLTPWQVHISLLGATELTHDKITRVRGSFQGATEAAKLLKERGVTVFLMTPLLHQNIFEFRETKAIANEIGVMHFSSTLIYPKKDGGSEPLECRPTIEDLETYYYPEIIKSGSSIRKPNKEKSLICQAGRTSVSINPKGEVYPCIMFPLVLGKLREMSLKEIWNSSEQLRYLRSITTSDIVECYSCADRDICGRCMALAYLSQGDILATPKECCRQTKLERRWFYEKEKV